MYHVLSMVATPTGELSPDVPSRAAPAAKLECVSVQTLVHNTEAKDASDSSLNTRNAEPIHVPSMVDGATTDLGINVQKAVEVE
jgi:hypothetical protein